MWGIDQLSNGELSGLRKRLRGSNCGLLTHAAAIDKRGLTLRQVLEELGVTPSVLFTPEHGLYGDAQAEQSVGDDQTPQGNDDLGPRVISLYGDDRESLSPQAADLAGLDVLVIDLVDVGSRYYTYVWSALLAARAAQAAGVHTLLLDRPNPISGDPNQCEGRPQVEGYLSFVGLEPVPVRHGLTLAELVALHLDRDGHPLGKDGALSVVPCIGWERLRDADAWGRPFVPPSPNMPTLETAYLYPGACLVEGTNLSEGRGTSFPFRVVGAPFINGEQLASALTEAHLPGLMVRPVVFRPSFEKHAGQRCEGVMLHITDRRSFRPVTTFLTLTTVAHHLFPEDFKFPDRVYEFENEIPAFDLLTGSNTARQAILDNARPADVVQLLAPVDAAYSDTIREAEALMIRARA